MKRKPPARNSAQRSTAERQHQRAENATTDRGHPIETLQQQAGNQAVQALHERGALQAKLAVSSPNDPAEREAERVAEKVMHEKSSAEEASVGAAPNVQRSASGDVGGETLTGDAESQVRSSLGSGRPLPEAPRSSFESRFGRDFSDVRVHTGSKADEAARSINAAAFTLGGDIVFASGNYREGSDAGERLLAHELTHVVQQGADAQTVHRFMPVVTGVGPPEWIQEPVGDFVDGAVDFAGSAAGYAGSIIETMGLGVERTAETAWSGLGGAVGLTSTDRFYEIGEENLQAFDIIKRVADNESELRRLLDTVLPHYAGEVYECLPGPIQREVREKLIEESLAYGSASLAVGAALQTLIGESLIKTIVTLVAARKVTKEVLSMATTWALTFVLGGLLKVQGMLQRASRAKQQLATLRPKLFGELDRQELTMAYFLVGEIEAEIKQTIRDEVGRITSGDVPDLCVETAPEPADPREEVEGRLSSYFGLRNAEIVHERHPFDEMSEEDVRKVFSHVTTDREQATALLGIVTETVGRMPQTWLDVYKNVYGTYNRFELPPFHNQPQIHAR